MILQALHAYYQILLEQEGDHMPREEYSSADITFEIYLDETGRVASVTPFVNDLGKNMKRTMIVPKQPKRSGSGIYPYFICEKAEYLFGSALSMREACRDGMISLWRAVLSYDTSSSYEIRALEAFLDHPVDSLANQLQQVLGEDVMEALGKGGLCVLKYAPTGKYFHQDRYVQQAWERYYRNLQVEPDAEEQMCLITGDMTPMNQIARLHPSIKNVIGAQSSGATIVSFNIPSFCSYGKDQSYNAPTSQKAADAYGYVLNRLLADPKHRVRMNDATVVFWADTAAEREQDLLANLFEAYSDEEDAADTGKEIQDAVSIRTRLKGALERVRQGQEFRDAFDDLKVDTKFYILGLSPNAARLSIRFWYTGTLEEIGGKVWQHYKDLSVIGLEKTPTIRQLLREIAVARDWKNVPPNMEGQIFRSIMLGVPYSRAVFAQLMNRIRAESDDPKKGLYKISAVRAAIIKAYLTRNARLNQDKKTEGELTMALNEQSTCVPYHLGRLFACLEKTQGDALGKGINATIRDRFWGAASATPATTFPRLISVSRHHIAKDDQWGWKNDQLIQQVIDALPEKFPRRLSLEEQGMFALGYYHQKQNFYSKKTSDNQNEEERGIEQ